MEIVCPKCGEVVSGIQSVSLCPRCGTRVMDMGIAANTLAHCHYQLEPGISQILRYTCQAGVEFASAEPIKLLEVNSNTMASGVLPLFFGPAPASGIPFPSVIVEVTPDEYQKIQSRELKLPVGWDVPEALPKLSGCDGGA